MFLTEKKSKVIIQGVNVDSGIVLPEIVGTKVCKTNIVESISDSSNPERDFECRRLKSGLIEAYKVGTVTSKKW